MKKITSLFLLLSLLLFTSCTWIGAASRDESSLAIGASSLTGSSIASSESLQTSESAVPSYITTSPTVPLSGTWEFFAEYNDTKFHYHLVFGEDGAIEYIASWYMSDTAERFKGTYAYDGAVLEFIAIPTLYPDDTPSLHCISNLEVSGDNLEISYNSADKMYSYQGDETAVWTKV